MSDNVRAGFVTALAGGAILVSWWLGLFAPFTDELVAAVRGERPAPAVSPTPSAGVA